MGRVDEIRKRLETATDGPWETNEASCGCCLDVCSEQKRGRVLICTPDIDDAPLIANAPTDIAYLLRLVKELEFVLWKADRNDQIAAAYKRAEAEPNSEEVSDD